MNTLRPIMKNAGAYEVPSIFNISGPIRWLTCSWLAGPCFWVQSGFCGFPSKIVVFFVKQNTVFGSVDYLECSIGFKLYQDVVLDSTLSFQEFQHHWLTLNVFFTGFCCWAELNHRVQSMFSQICKILVNNFEIIIVCVS